MSMNLTLEGIAEIEKNIAESIDELLARDVHLIKEDLNERCITHMLAIYLKKYFKDYDVDCEYNGNVDSGNRRKIVDRDLNIELDDIKDENLKTELKSRFLYPDIIIHQRGANENNLCIIEVKKSTNRIGGSYDEKKLMFYTDTKEEQGLKYGIGFFLKLQTGKDFDKEGKANYFLEKYVNGQCLTKKT